MQYLCLIYSDESQWPKLPKEEYDRLVHEYLGYMDDIRKSGHYLGSNRLQPTGAATTVRVRGGQLTTTDGPFAAAGPSELRANSRLARMSKR